MAKNLTKLYAAFRSGCLGDNILDVYLPFFANIIYEENWDIVEEKKVATKFNEKYDFDIPLTFVRQVLGVGMTKGLIFNDRGQYKINKEQLKSYNLDDGEFNVLWCEMMECFKSYCVDNNIDILAFDIENRILSFLESYDEDVVTNELYIPEQSDLFDYAWHIFIKDLSNTNSKLFDFVVALSSSNIMMQTAFYSGDAKETYKGLNVYLDSPIVFALLGMDSPARVESCKMLVSEMQNAGCYVKIFDHNFQEINGIMARTSGWVTSTEYDIQKANNVAQYFHDILVDAPSIAEFCESIESKLNEMGITIKRTIYDSSKKDFQEDEEELYSMIEEKYCQQGVAIQEDKKSSIMMDVRSIIMIYRERSGQTSTKIQTSGHIMITLNATIANVSKKYESNRSIQSGHIPACISSDLFGAILWLFSPANRMEYQRKRLLADCYVALRPSKEMLERYIDSLSRARASGEIDEKSFLFMRAHSAVNDALMNVTKGDYARFNDQTYREVYDKIIDQANKKYLDEISSHMHTKEQLEVERSKIEKLTKNIEDMQAWLDAKDKSDFDKKCNIWGWIYTGFFVGIPYIVILAIVEISKSFYNNFSYYSMLYVIAFLLITVAVKLFFYKGKNWCFTKVEEHFREKTKSTSKL